jgi:hypothetical protein
MLSSTVEWQGLGTLGPETRVYPACSLCQALREICFTLCLLDSTDVPT